MTYTIKVSYSPMSATWNISNKTKDVGNVRANTTYGTQDMNAYRLIEEALNLKTVKIYKAVEGPDGKETRVLDPEGTALAQQKQDEIKEKFREWIFKNPERREALVEEYNRRFNSTRAREYDGEHLRLGASTRRLSCGSTRRTPLRASSTAEIRCWRTRWGRARPTRWLLQRWRESAWGCRTRASSSSRIT